MQQTSEIYKELLEAQQLGDPSVKFQTRLTIGEPGVLITKQGDSITFGSKSYTKTATGSTIVLTETEDRPLKGLTLYGKTTQNGTPSPDAPIPLDSVGDDGSITVKVGTSETDGNPQTLIISTPNGLHGIPVTSGGNYTDGNGQQWICDEVDFEKGVYVRRIGAVNFADSGTSILSRSTTGTSGKYRFVISNDSEPVSSSGVTKNLFCTVAPAGNANDTWVGTNCACYATIGSILLYLDEIASMTVTEATAWLRERSVKVQYILAAPTETALSAEQLAAFAELHTNYPNTTVINDSGAPMEIAYTMNGEGPTRILTGASGADSGYDETLLISMETDSRVFSENTPDVGASISSQIDIEMIKPFAELPKQARLVPYVRLTNGAQHSEWIQKGVYYIDTRAKVEDGSSIEKIVLHGYDDMLKAEQDYPASKLAWPAKDVDVVREIAEFIGVSIDDRTLPLINRSYTIQYPTGYSCRDVLGYIAAMYAGSFIMSDLGDLRLVTIYGIPKETRYLIEPNGYVITIGGDRILV